MVKGSEITEVSTAVIFMIGVNPVRDALNFYRITASMTLRRTITLLEGSPRQLRQHCRA
jgi:hypothetical protein